MSAAGAIATLMLDFACRERFRACVGMGGMSSDYRRANAAFWRAWSNLTEEEQRALHGPYGKLPCAPRTANVPGGEGGAMTNCKNCEESMAEAKRLLELYEEKREEWIARLGALERENAELRRQLGLATEGSTHGAS